MFGSVCIPPPGYEGREEDGWRVQADSRSQSEGLRLGAWRGSDSLPGPFRWSDGPIRILRLRFGPTGVKLVGSTC